MSEAGVDDDPLLGKVLSGRFQIVEPLGVGGMGRVYKAIQQPLDRVVALKVLNPRYDGTKDPGFERRFFLEASMTAKLKHPNTITVHDYGRTDDGIYFIAMEYLEGETLQQVLAREGPMIWSRALAVGAQVARSLREAHKLGLVHRDLKPANVLLAGQGDALVPRLADFGISRLDAPISEADGETFQRGDRLTRTGVFLGTPLYMAPEQATNAAGVGPSADVFSFGVMAYELLTRQLPFTPPAVFRVMAHAPIPPPALRLAKLEGLPAAVGACLDACLSFDPASRPDAATLAEVLSAAVTPPGAAPQG